MRGRKVVCLLLLLASAVLLPLGTRNAISTTWDGGNGATNGDGIPAGDGISWVDPYSSGTFTAASGAALALGGTTHTLSIASGTAGFDAVASLPFLALK